MRLSELPEALAHAFVHRDAVTPPPAPLPTWVDCVGAPGVPIAARHAQRLDVTAGVRDQAGRFVGARATVYELEGDWAGTVERTVDGVACALSSRRLHAQCEDATKRLAVEALAAHLHRVWAIAGALTDDDPNGTASDVMARLVRCHVYADL